MKAKANVQLLDPRQVRHRRLQLGLTESYLGSLCGVSSSVIRRLESGWPQDDLSARFITLLAEQLGTAVADLLADSHQEDVDDAAVEERTAADARQVGALLLAVAEPVPADAVCEVLDMGFDRLDDAVALLNVMLDEAGGIVVDTGSTLTIADDMADIDRDVVDEAMAATFARRRPNLPELRAIHEMVQGKVVRREDLDTATGRTLARLRSIGVLANADKPIGVKSDPPILSEDVRYSLVLDRSDALTAEKPPS